MPAGPVKILLIESNVYLVKRLGEALRHEGYEVTHSTSGAYALTMLEWNTPSAILCATNLREMGALEIAPILRADPKTAEIPVIALGSGGEQALMEAYRAGCDEYIDRRVPPAEIAQHVRNFLQSRQIGFQPTQMLPIADTELSGNLQHLDLPGVMQMLAHARQTGALHINAGVVDGIIFFDAGELSHAEYGEYFGDEAVCEIVRSCYGVNAGVYKFMYGVVAAQRTVLRSATDLMLDAMREVDEANLAAGPIATLAEEQTDPQAGHQGDHPSDLQPNEPANEQADGHLEMDAAPEQNLWEQDSQRAAEPAADERYQVEMEKES
jgi:CheY-like chemotaxis protein